MQRIRHCLLYTLYRDAIRYSKTLLTTGGSIINLGIIRFYGCDLMISEIVQRRFKRSEFM